jgi:hypothetical protein
MFHIPFNIPVTICALMITTKIRIAENSHVSFTPSKNKFADDDYDYKSTNGETTLQ